MKKQTAEKFINCIPDLLWIPVLFVFALLFLTLPKTAFSETENRILSSCPAPTAEGILDGSFREEFETYLSDQFPFRDELLSLSVGFSRICGMKKINDVIYAEENDGSVRLIDDYKTPQNEDKFTEAVKRLEEGTVSADLTVMIVPTAYWICEDEMPDVVRMQDRAKQQDTAKRLTESIVSSDKEGRVRVVKGIDTFLKEGRDQGISVYYRTDHHWTLRGAYMGYLALAPYLELPVNEALPGGMHPVSETFYGTTWSRVVDHTVKPDTLEIYENPQWESGLTVTYEDTGETFDSPYNMEYLNAKDKYSVFLNNQHSLIRICNKNADLERTGDRERRALAVVKDSYANSLIPLLIDQYETIWVFDPRYYRGSITQWINDHPEVEDVLVLYNLATLDNDRGPGAVY